VTQGSRSIRRYIPPLLFDAPDFRRLWFGQTISVFGDQITQLGLPLVAVLTLGADATQMGTLTAVGLLPHLLFSLVAGVWLDRVRARRRLMIAADLGRAALIASTAIPNTELSSCSTKNQRNCHAPNLNATSSIAGNAAVTTVLPCVKESQVTWVTAPSNTAADARANPRREKSRSVSACHSFSGVVSI
jgi:MFS family permease